MRSLLLIVAMLVTSGSLMLTVKQTKAQSDNAQLTVYYTHSTKRCVSCRVVENETKKILNEDFKSELESGTLKFIAVNIDDADKKEFAQKHKVWGSSLLLVKTNTGETINMSRDAFRYSRREPETYRQKLTKAIRDNLI